MIVVNGMLTVGVASEELGERTRLLGTFGCRVEGRTSHMPREDAFYGEETCLHYTLGSPVE
jgi:hypothetical protein